jgi:hypothetical protein
LCSEPKVKMKPSWVTFGLLATASAAQFKRTPSHMLRRDEVTDPKQNETDLVVNHHYIVEFSGVSQVYLRYQHQLTQPGN